MKVSPERGKIFTHLYTDTLVKQQVSYIEIGLLDEMRDHEFNLLLCNYFDFWFIIPKPGTDRQEYISTKERVINVLLLYRDFERRRPLFVP